LGHGVVKQLTCYF